MITGSRRGEVSAVRWRHIDSDRAALWIHRSNAQTKAGITEKETKTGQHRKVALDPHTLSLLEQHRKLWEQRCADLGCALDADAFVSLPRQTVPVRMPRGRSVSDTAEWRSSSNCAAPAF